MIRSRIRPLLIDRQLRSFSVITITDEKDVTKSKHAASLL